MLVSTAFGATPKYPALSPLEIKVPRLEEHELSSGLKVLFLVDNSVPLVQGGVVVQMGQVHEPEGQSGIMGLTAALMRSGGAGKLGPEDFDRAVEDLAATLDVTPSEESLESTFKCLSEDLNSVLGLWADMMLRPAFDGARLESEKEQAVDTLSRLDDTPNSCARVLAQRGLFLGHPLGRWATALRVRKLSRQDLVDFRTAHFGPAGAVLSIAGRFDPKKTLDRLEQVLAGWKGASALPEFPAVHPPAGRIFFKAHNDKPGVTLRLLFQGFKYHDPDETALMVANHILGGSGFTSRLMRKIRSDKGLAYAVGSAYASRSGQGSRFVVAGDTRPEAVTDYLKTAFEIVKEFSQNGPTEEELAESKSALIEEFAFNLETPFALATQLANLRFLGYPAEYLDGYRDRVRAVTRDQVTSAAARLFLDKPWVMGASGPATVLPALASFGNVTEVQDILGPLN